MHKHIAKALQARSQAIKAAAAVLDAPREGLSWEEVVDYIFLSDFDLLHSSHHDILSEGWVKPAGHAAMDQYFKIMRSDEEINCLNIEIRQLITYMGNEDGGRKFASVGCFNNGHHYRITTLVKVLSFSGSFLPEVAADFTAASLGDDDNDDGEDKADALEATFQILNITADLG
ncbi:hypothetical protein C8R44DRAFT_886135 [Mycena epipterygia]|nr:hypothetical protein C8R44DRAFT_886135 [Mycena epipterygia]